MPHRTPDHADRLRFSQLVLAHRGKLLGYLRGLGAAPDLAEDCLQEALVRAYRALPELASWSRGRAWLFGIARHVFLDELRRRKVRSRPLPPDGAAPVARDPEESLAASDRTHAVRRAVARLEPPQPELIELHYRAGLTMTEIGEVTGLPTGTVKTHLFRARARLRELLAADGESEDE